MNPHLLCLLLLQLTIWRIWWVSVTGKILQCVLCYSILSELMKIILLEIGVHQSNKLSADSGEEFIQNSTKIRQQKLEFWITLFNNQNFLVELIFDFFIWSDYFWNKGMRMPNIWFTVPVPKIVSVSTVMWRDLIPYVKRMRHPFIWATHFLPKIQLQQLQFGLELQLVPQMSKQHCGSILLM